MRPDDSRHGTYAGAMTHRREHDELCDDCRRALNAYMRAWRQNHPEKVATQARRSAAMSRALWRLAKLHDDDLRALLDEEMRSDD